MHIRSTRTSGNADPDVLNDLGSGTTTVRPPIGFHPPPLAVSKTSNAGGTVFPGQTVTYTVTVTNYTGVTQTGINVFDPVPVGTTPPIK